MFNDTQRYFMAMGTFARIGNISGDKKFFDKCFALYNDSAVRRGLWSVRCSGCNVFSLLERLFT